MTIQRMMNQNKILHQAIAAWIILPVSAIVFASVALIISQVVASQDLVVILALACVAPVMIWVYVFLYRQGLYDRGSNGQPLLGSGLMTRLRSYIDSFKFSYPRMMVVGTVTTLLGLIFVGYMARPPFASISADHTSEPILGAPAHSNRPDLAGSERSRSSSEGGVVETHANMSPTALVPLMTVNAGAAGLTPLASPLPVYRELYVIAPSLDLREGPGDDYSVVKVVPKGAKVGWWGEAENINGFQWFYVQVGGDVGWAFAGYVGLP